MNPAYVKVMVHFWNWTEEAADKSSGKELGEKAKLFTKTVYVKNFWGRHDGR